MLNYLYFQNDDRKYFPISTFGFYRSGYLNVDVTKFKINPANADKEVWYFGDSIGR